MAGPFSISIYNVQMFHILTKSCLLYFDNSYPNKCEVLSHCGFDMHSLMISTVEHLFMFLLTIYVFFGKMSV